MIPLNYIKWLGAYHTSVLTIALHYFVILLVTKHEPGVLDVSSAIAVRQEIDETLNVMETLGRSSLITQKAGCCIKRLLAIFDTLGACLATHVFNGNFPSLTTIQETNSG